MRSLAVIGFVVVVGAGALMLARQPTVARGHVLEAELLDQLRAHGVTAMACDREVPIGRHGATFTCVATMAEGGAQTVAYTMDREGSLTASVQDAAEAAAEASSDGRGMPSAGSAAEWQRGVIDGRGERDRPRIPPSGDPWAN